MVPRGWCHKWCEYVYFVKYNFLRLLLFLTFRWLCAYLKYWYRLTNLPKSKPNVWDIRCWSSSGCFSFRPRKKTVCVVEICDSLSAKSGNFSLNRALVNGYFIAKWHCYIYRQLDCHFKRFYSNNLIIWISQILFELINFNQVSRTQTIKFPIMQSFNSPWSNLGITMSPFLKLYYLS